MKNVMVDLETLGQTPGFVVLSIGAVEFNRNGLGKEFYEVINVGSSMEHYLAVEEKTKTEFWDKQSHEARQVLRDASNEETSVPLPQALDQFNRYLTTLDSKRNIAVWGNGSEFDNAGLNVAYKMAGIEPAWEFWNNRCYRTLKNLIPGPKLVRVGTYHNALDDAKSQALHAIELLNSTAGANLLW